MSVTACDSVTAESALRACNMDLSDASCHVLSGVGVPDHCTLQSCPLPISAVEHVQSRKRHCSSAPSSEAETDLRVLAIMEMLPDATNDTVQAALTATNYNTEEAVALLCDSNSGSVSGTCCAVGL